MESCIYNVSFPNGMLSVRHCVWQVPGDSPPLSNISRSFDGKGGTTGYLYLWIVSKMNATIQGTSYKGQSLANPTFQHMRTPR